MPRLMKTYKQLTFGVRSCRGEMWEIVSAQHTEGASRVNAEGFAGMKVCDMALLEMLKRGATIMSP